jgi:hypothetical protein
MQRAVRITGKPVKRTNNYHVLPVLQGWDVKGENSSRAVGVYKTQEAAVMAGRLYARAKGGKLIIHGLDGKIRAHQ